MTSQPGSAALEQIESTVECGGLGGLGAIPFKKSYLGLRWLFVDIQELKHSRLKRAQSDQERVNWSHSSH